MSITCRFGWPRSVRLRRSADFRVVQRDGRRFHTQALQCRAVRGEGPGARCGLSVSRKVGNAVARNRVKRCLREALRHLLGGLPTVDLVIIARPEAAQASAEALRAQVEQVLTKVRERSWGG